MPDSGSHELGAIDLIVVDMEISTLDVDKVLCSASLL